MDYKRDLNLEMEPIKCDCGSITKLLIVLVLFMAVLVLCTKSNSTRKIQYLKVENETLRSLIMNSVDNMIVNMLKNGSDNDNQHEE